MNKISIYALTFFLSLSSVTVYSQKNNKQVIFTNEQGSDIFYHTIERGQTVYAIATMYGVSVEDIYRLNPESKEGIKAGSTLRIPQKDSAIAPSGKADNSTQFFDYEGTQAQRIFYMPAYRTEAEKRSPVPDFRHTLLWRPDIRTAGESSISIPFTTSDLTGDFTITIEGLTQTGEALYATEQFQVK